MAPAGFATSMATPSLNPRQALRHSFPGPRLAAAAFVLAPVLLVAGAVLMMPFEAGTDEARQQQLAGQPLRAEAAQNVYTAGTMLGGVAALAMARLIAPRSPGFAAWGGGLALAGSYLSAFWSGVMTFEVALAGIPDRALAAGVLEAAAPPLVMMAALPGLALGWAVLAVGAHRAGVLGIPRALALAATAATPLAVLSGTALLLPFPFVGMAIGLVPLGWALLRAPPASAAGVEVVRRAERAGGS